MASRRSPHKPPKPPPPVRPWPRFGTHCAKPGRPPPTNGPPTFPRRSPVLIGVPQVRRHQQAPCPVNTGPAEAPHLESHPHAPSHSRHLRHLHGRPRGHRPRGRPPRHRLRCQCLPADERPVARAGYRSDRRLWRRSIGAACRRLRDRQRGQPRQSADGGHPGCRRGLHQRAAVAGRAHAARPACAGGGGHARQDQHHVDAGLGAGPGRPGARLPGGRRTAELRHFGPAGPGGAGQPALAAVCDRGR